MRNEDAAAQGQAASAIEKISAFQRFGSVLGLGRIEKLLDLLGNPQRELRVLHVAGTNGKGSICRYLYCTLRAAGYRTGLYTSPFLEVFNERIEVDGAYISDGELASYTDRVLEKVREMVDAGFDSPTEFEVITALAFLYFRERQCDYVVLEVGLGGRGDSTNVCEKPLVSVIASISYDHTDRLGHTLAAIAGEKAGIIKEGCPVVTSATSEEALAVIRRTATEKHAPCYETKRMPVSVEAAGPWGSRFTAAVLGETFSGLTLSMAGPHQVQNAVAALTALQVLRLEGKAEVSREAIYEGFRTARQPGRLERMQDAPAVIIDGAHNEDGARALRASICQLYPDAKVLMVAGVLADKDVEGILTQFLGITKDMVLTEPDSPRKLPASALAEKVAAMGGRVLAVEPRPEAAVETALSMAEAYDLLLVAGSLYMIGTVRTYLRTRTEGLCIEETEAYERLVPFFIENGLEFDEEEKDFSDVLCAWQVTRTGDDRLLGGAMLVMQEGHFVVQGIAVDKVLRGQGIGRKLIALVEAEIRRRGGHEVLLMARKPAFYRKLGFHAVEPGAAPPIFDCLGCPQYGVDCFPEIMARELDGPPGSAT